MLYVVVLATLFSINCSKEPSSPRLADDQAGLAEAVTLIVPGEEPPAEDPPSPPSESEASKYPTEPDVGRVIEPAGYQMIRVEPGTFMFGKPDDVSDDDAPEAARFDNPRGCWFYPATPCHIERPFLLGRTEVTVGLWRAVGFWPDPERSPVIRDLDECPRPPASSEQPLTHYMTNLDRWHVYGFMNELSRLEGLEPAYTFDAKNRGLLSESLRWNPEANGYRLPTEAEWEYAARAGQDFLYAGSNDLGEVTILGDRYPCRLNGSEYDRMMHPVAQRAPNAWGFFDMSGNVNEIVHRVWTSSDGKAVNACPQPSYSSCGEDAFLQSRASRGGSNLCGAWCSTVFVSEGGGIHGLRLARNAD